VPPRHFALRPVVRLIAGRLTHGSSSPTFEELRACTAFASANASRL